MRWVWQVRTDAVHTVVADISLVTSKEKIWVDGELAADVASMKLKNEHSVALGDAHLGVVVVKSSLLGPKCSLLVEGREIPPVPKEKWQKDLPAEPRDANLVTFAFFVICVVVPIVMMRGSGVASGAMWGGLGGAAGGLCLGIYNIRSLSAGMRIALCALVTLGWTGFCIWMKSQLGYPTRR